MKFLDLPTHILEPGGRDLIFDLFFGHCVYIELRGDGDLEKWVVRQYAEFDVGN